jgi:hypothetical protein
VAPPVFKTGLAGNTLAGRFDSFPPPPSCPPWREAEYNETKNDKHPLCVSRPDGCMDDSSLFGLSISKCEGSLRVVRGL